MKNQIINEIETIQEMIKFSDTKAEKAELRQLLQQSKKELKAIEKAEDKQFF